ncbi:MAG TPA: Calx-beta domain-containing protein [Candidatus Saccharimonadales bacterium]|nr:Calx-beta domain-containing protein [Candidatus Saccharimonadales bacterium]
MGIDLDQIGVTPNDPGDSDDGANKLQNFPTLTSVISNGNSTTIQGSLKSTPNTVFQIDFYSNAALDPSGNGEGALFFNTTSVTTDTNGDATINVTLPLALVAGRVVTATATDPDGNTSEFSAADSSGATGNVQFSVSSIQVIEDLSHATITVVRNGGSTGNLTVDYATADGTATAGQDYTATSGTLTFSGGETSKTFQIPIIDDATTEPDEIFTVALRNTSSIDSLGIPNTLVITVQDRATIPTLSLTSASVVEGTGSATEVLFTLSLSAATGRLVTVNYATSNFSATGGVTCNNQGVDYETASGSLSFQPGNTALNIPVKICGDTSAEANETFLLTLSNPSNATSDSQALGTILNDDVLELVLEDSDPTTNQAAALDAIFLLRDPFRVVSIPEWFPTGLDRNTRLTLFVRNLQLNPGEQSSAVVARLVGSNNQVLDSPAEDVRAVPNTDLTQVVIRLPDNLSAGTCRVTIRAHGHSSNTGTIRVEQ